MSKGVFKKDKTYTTVEVMAKVEGALTSTINFLDVTQEEEVNPVELLAQHTHLVLLGLFGQKAVEDYIDDKLLQIFMGTVVEDNEFLDSLIDILISDIEKDGEDKDEELLEFLKKEKEEVKNDRH